MLNLRLLLALMMANSSYVILTLTYRPPCDMVRGFAFLI